MTSKYAMNKTEAANYWKKSPNTIKKVIEANDIQPCGRDARGNDVYECKDLAPYLVEQKSRTRRRGKTLSDDKREEIAELIGAFGSMKEFKEYELALAQKQKRETEQGQLLPVNHVSAVLTGMFAILRKKGRQITTEAERICDGWLPRHSERFDQKIEVILKEVTRSAQEYADAVCEHSGGDE
ncbi:hypothetical protein KCG43_20160 [Photobacterium sp. WH24]|uniref:hypothetical protein n=1 Tax=Photobacterium sp. WH24 TaxID=2827237 RepID=UPI001C453898|nr:hypothetical protein [Photobacterium sp. WH24]MBV7264329.1 hypothetical protein [Photobacterium sp. WH24]